MCYNMAFPRTQCYHLFWVTPASSARRTCIFHYKSEKFPSENLFLIPIMKERGRILNSVCSLTQCLVLHSVSFYAQCVVLHTVGIFTQCVQCYTEFYTHYVCYAQCGSFDTVCILRHCVYSMTQCVSLDTLCTSFEIETLYIFRNRSTCLARMICPFKPFSLDPVIPGVRSMGPDENHTFFAVLTGGFKPIWPRIIGPRTSGPCTTAKMQNQLM